MNIKRLIVQKSADRDGGISIMCITRYNLLLIVIGLFPFDIVVSGNINSVMFTNLYSSSPKHKGAISAYCTGDMSSEKIKCEFTYMRLRYDLDPKELNKRMKEIKLFSKNKKYKESEESVSFCEGVKKKWPEFELELKKTDELSKAYRDDIRHMMDLCTNSEEGAYFKYFSRQVVIDSKTCLVTNYPFWAKLEFTKVKANKWVANEGPVGPCNKIVLHEIENEPDRPYNWTYKKTIIHAEQDNKECAGDFVIGKPIVYSYKNPSIDMKCEYIRFGNW